MINVALTGLAQWLTFISLGVDLAVFKVNIES